MDPREKPNAADKADTTVRAVRTFESDIAEVLKHNNVTVASMAIAENTRQQKTDQTKTHVLDAESPQQSTVPTPTTPAQAQKPLIPVSQSKAIDLEARLHDAFNNPFEKPEKVDFVGGQQIIGQNTGQSAPQKPEVMVQKPQATQRPESPLEPSPQIQQTQPKSDPVPQSEPKSFVPPVTIVPARAPREYSQVIRNNPEPSHIGRNFTLLVASALLIAGGLYGGYYFYNQSPLAGPEPSVTNQTNETLGLIQRDGYTLSTVTKKNREGIQQALRDGGVKALQAKGSIVETFIVEPIPETNQSQALSTQKFFEYIGSRIPSALLRSLNSRFVVGHHKIGSETYPFFVFHSQYFQNSFAGIIKWEPFMYEDLSFMIKTGNFIPQAVTLPSSLPIATSTGTTTSQDTSSTTINILPQPTVGGSVSIYKPKTRFVDALKNNRDIRIMVDENDNKLLYYSFITRELLVISTHEATLLELMNREDKRALLR